MHVLEATSLRAAALNDDRKTMEGVLLRQAALREILSELEVVFKEVDWLIGVDGLRKKLQSKSDRERAGRESIAVQPGQPLTVQSVELRRLQAERGAGR